MKTIKVVQLDVGETLNHPEARIADLVIDANWRTVKNRFGPVERKPCDESTAQAATKTPTLDELDAIDGMFQDASDRLDRLLRKRGWEHKCNTPGAYWMWQKTLPDGRVILCNAATAQRIEAELCEERWMEEASEEELSNGEERGVE